MVFGVGLLGGLVLMLAWGLFGADPQWRVTRVWVEQAGEGKSPQHYQACADPADPEREVREAVDAGEYQRLAAALAAGERPAVEVRVLQVGRWVHAGSWDGG